MAKREARSRLSLLLSRETLRRAIFAASAFGALVAGIVVFHNLEQFLTDDERFALLEPEVPGEISPSVQVYGVRYASLESVRNVFREDSGKSLYEFPAAERRQSLLQVDWVREAAVARMWPHNVEVTIREREPVAYVQLAAGTSGTTSAIALIDEDGVILEKPSRMDADLPVLSGIGERQTEEARVVRVRRAMALLDEIGDLEDSVSVVDVSDPTNIELTVDAGERSVTLNLGRERYRDKLTSFFEHWPEIHRQLPDATEFDLRLDDRITALNGIDE